MAWTFNNGVITGDNGYNFDLNQYLQSAQRGGGDTTGGIGALHSFYDNYAVNRGGATNPTNALLGGATYLPSYMGEGGANQASQIGGSLLPQIQSWWQQNYKNPAQQNALAPPAPPAASTPPKQPPRQNAGPAQPPPNPWAMQPKPPSQTAGAATFPDQMSFGGGFNESTGRYYDPAKQAEYEREVAAQEQARKLAPNNPQEQYRLYQEWVRTGKFPTQTTGGTGGFPALPPGFNLRTGSTDPNDPTGQNQAVYGTNYFPGGLPGFEGITNAQQFAGLTPEQQGSYREALYLWNMRRQGYGPQPGGVVPPLPGDPVGNPNYTPPPNLPPPPGGGGTGGGGGATQPYQNPPFGSTGPNPLGPPGFQGGADQNNSGFPFPGAYTAPPFEYSNVQDFTQNPAYQAKLKESERALNRQLLNMGRSDSTGGMNAFATNARRLGAEFEQEAYNRAKGENVLNYDRFLGENMTAYDRALTINKLTYDRAYQESVLNYEREFRENERKYGRDMAENILAYERTFREDAREYERVRYLYETGAVGSMPVPSGA